MFSQRVIGSLFVVALATTGSLDAVADEPVASDQIAVASSKSSLTTTTDDEFERRCRPLFDGTILSQWEGHAYWFRTEGKSIVAGRLEQKIPTNKFLGTMDQFDNFDLRMDVRMRGQGRNAGVQFRSRRPLASDEGIPKHEMIGYQADMGIAWKESVWGALYDESRRRKMLVVPEPRFDVEWKLPVTEDGPPEGSVPNGAVPTTDWFELRIVCVGDSIEIFLNDRRTIQYTETEDGIPRHGVIGLQIHSGPPAEAWYRNVRILSL